MSVFRVITRIIPLSSSDSTFEPASFDQLTDGNVGEIKVLVLTEPQSGMKYRIERVEYVQNVKPGESIDSINKDYAEKLKTIPGFVQFKSDDLPLNPYDKSFQLTLPKVLFGHNSDESSSSNSFQESKNSDSFKISVVKNFNFKKGSYKPKKSASTSSEHEADGIHLNAKFKVPKFQAESKALFKPKYPTYLSKKLKNSVWRNKKSFSNFKTKKMIKFDKSLNSFQEEFSTKNTNFKKTSKSATNFVNINKKIDSEKELSTRLPDKAHKNNNDMAQNSLNKKHIQKLNGDISIRNEKENCSDDDLTEFESGELIINVPEAELKSPMEDSSKNRDSIFTGSPSILPHFEEFGSTNVNNCSISNNSSAEESSSNHADLCQESGKQSKSVSEDSLSSNKFIIPDGHPAFELLVALKRYFVNGECLICGFIPAENDFNAFDHMQLHTLSNSFTSSYKCSCCDEKFSNPRNLYMHALSREKSYNYMCNICLLKFKRKHYLTRHAAKSH